MASGFTLSNGFNMFQVSTHRKNPCCILIITEHRIFGMKHCKYSTCFNPAQNNPNRFVGIRKSSQIDWRPTSGHELRAIFSIEKQLASAHADPPTSGPRSLLHHPGHQNPWATSRGRGKNGPLGKWVANAKGR